MAHSELGAASRELHAKLEASDSSHKEAAAAHTASEVRAAALEETLSSCRGELEASRSAAMVMAASKAALEGRVAELGARVGELESALIATQKEVAARFAESVLVLLHSLHFVRPPWEENGKLVLR